MSAVQKISAAYLTEDEYLERERKALDKSEYIAGEIHAMAGGSVNHNGISANCIIALGKKLPKGCRVLTSDMRVYNPHTASYLYPDVSVVCGKPDIRKGECLTNPTLVVEVLSRSTANYDQSTKLRLYGAMPSLNEYLIVSSFAKDVVLFRRNEAGRWEVFPVDADRGEITLESLGCTITVEELYGDIDIETLPSNDF